MADGWIELFDVETDEAELLFVFDRFEPVDYGCGVFHWLEVRLVILKCYECVFVGCTVHSVVDFQFCRDGFVFFMDCLRRLGLCFLVRFCDVFFKQIVVCRWL